MSYQQHQELAGQRPVPTAVITCSDSRTVDDDTSGRLIRTLLDSHNHPVPFHAISKDDPALIRNLLMELSERADISAVILNGGTGVSRRDNTFDAVSALLTKTLPGFGEIFRMLSYQTIGSGAILSRATAGIIVTANTVMGAGSAHGPATRHTLVFSIPGSPQAVELAMTKLILPEISHLVWETLR